MWRITEVGRPALESVLWENFSDDLFELRKKRIEVANINGQKTFWESRIVHDKDCNWEMNGGIYETERRPQ